LQALPKTPLAQLPVTNWAATTLERPLFRASRRQPIVITGEHHVATPEEARLSGIMIGRFGRLAIFATAGGGKPLVLAEGGHVNESTIRRIEVDRVVLANGLTALLKPDSNKNHVANPYISPFQQEIPNYAALPIVNGQRRTSSFSFSHMPQLPPQLVERGLFGTDGQPDHAVPIVRGQINANRRE